mmetsp:Transcript_8203/g.15981  ORF Transcript_8203/g.15981 Transcript_8203/m.15981 type:complete len:122 (-) Transcript_8203:151-516(-)
MYAFCLSIPYGLLVMAAGLWGFLKAGSMISMLTGFLFGGTLVFCGYKGYNAYMVDPKKVLAHWTVGSLTSSAILSITMGIRFQKTGKMWPAGIILSSSLVMSGFYIIKLLEKKTAVKKKPS